MTLAHELFYAALEAADPELAVLGARLGAAEARILSGAGAQGRLRVIAAGKAAPAMMLGLRKRVRAAGGKISEAWIVSREGRPCQGTRKGERYLRAGHPLPTAASVRAARSLEQQLRASRPGDRWVILLSGGASSLLGAPRPPLSTRDLGLTVSALLRSGAPIEDINTVRKHLSLLAGGAMLERLGEAAAKHGRGIRVLTLALSDVPSDRLDVIGSGPSVPDPTSFQDCLRILRRQKLERQIPRPVHTYLKEGARGKMRETLKRIPVGVQAHARVIGGAGRSLRAAANLARRRGLPVRELGVLTGETRATARSQVRMVKRGLCLISGGELSVRVRGAGRGGRNTEFALAALCEWKRARGRGRFLVFSAGTDGKDGSTRSAGAWAALGALKRARELRLNPRLFLARNDSYSFFKKVGGLVTTGPTGTNVMDFRVVMVDPSA